MRLVNLFDARNILDGIMEVLDRFPEMTDIEKEDAKTKYATMTYVMNGDMNRIARTKRIVTSFINQIELGMEIPMIES